MYIIPEIQMNIYHISHVPMLIDIYRFQKIHRLHRFLYKMRRNQSFKKFRLALRYIQMFLS